MICDLCKAVEAQEDGNICIPIPLLFKAKRYRVGGNLENLE